MLCVFGRHAYGDPRRGEGYEHANFIPALRALGHEVELFESFDRSAWSDFVELNRRLVERVLDWKPTVVLMVLMAYEVWRETLDLLRECSPARLVHWSTDDSWKYAQFTRFIAPAFDLHVTTDASTVQKAQRDGFDNVVLSQWAARSDALAEPIEAARCRHRVSFVGAAYGNRLHLVDALAQRGIAVECFGHGWPNGVVDSGEVARIQRESIVSLNFAEAGRGAAAGRQIKARVFEIPGAGGFLLTEAVDGLERYYDLEREIAVFDGADALERAIRRFVDDPAQRDAIARAGQLRTSREHTYEQRFAQIFAALEARPAHDAVAAPDRGRIERRLDLLASRHRIGPGLRLLRGALVALPSAFFGRHRGARAARRFLFELCWRVAGSHTYSVRGLPGRLFYRES